ncbi:K(+)-transporting ATPase subunit C [Clostridium ihumii]|uniref:K(+)-transporting ATPase subunit C n=1 Tax=Clostridium ihumii TaxID=1470356 RepID=UPI00058B7BF9|nr:K(+)-transporting ATPase subunit C [Clostridium ihumii]
MKKLRKPIVVTLCLLLLCGVIYPLFLNGVSQIVFKDKANGSIIEINGKKVGSKLIGQKFTDKRFFVGRISSINYNTYEKDESYEKAASGSSNYGPSNKELVERVKSDMDEFLKNNPGVKKEDIPADILTNSASGLDPNISPKAAEIQIARVVRETGLSKEEVEKIVDECTDKKSFGIFGEDRVNVLEANLKIASKLGIEI